MAVKVEFVDNRMTLIPETDQQISFLATLYGQVVLDDNAKNDFSKPVKAVTYNTNNVIGAITLIRD